mmetsp:Transcript_29133/g.95035  ORF Transcript_29133/g.95035 Transcript_29133/m.95035 type:complete len:289 (+) Transcript_29133:1235-2101(+)
MDQPRQRLWGSAVDLGLGGRASRPERHLQRGGRLGLQPAGVGHHRSLAELGLHRPPGGRRHPAPGPGAPAGRRRHRGRDRVALPPGAAVRLALLRLPQPGHGRQGGPGRQHGHGVGRQGGQAGRRLGQDGPHHLHRAALALQPGRLRRGRQVAVQADPDAARLPRLRLRPRHLLRRLHHALHAHRLGPRGGPGEQAAQPGCARRPLAGAVRLAGRSHDAARLPRRRHLERALQRDPDRHRRPGLRPHHGAVRRAGGLLCGGCRLARERAQERPLPRLRRRRKQHLRWI